MPTGDYEQLFKGIVIYLHLGTMNMKENGIWALCMLQGIVNLLYQENRQSLAPIYISSCLLNFLILLLSDMSWALVKHVFFIWLQLCIITARPAR